MFRSSRTPGTGMFLFMDSAKQSARAGGKAIIDLSVGASDLPAPPEALQTLISAVEDPSTHSCGYFNNYIIMVLIRGSDGYRNVMGFKENGWCG